jgi:hypothetical protein
LIWKDREVQVATGHHLVLGEIVDFLTLRTLPDTLDERHRQKLARRLVINGHHPPESIRSRVLLTVSIDGSPAAGVPIDFVIRQDGLPAMLVKYGPGSLVTRHRSAIAAARLLAARPLPVTVVTNGEDADILATANGRVLGSGLEAIPDRETLGRLCVTQPISTLSAKKREREKRIFHVFEVDGRCPCDDTVCRERVP